MHGRIALAAVFVDVFVFDDVVVAVLGLDPRCCGSVCGLETLDPPYF